MIELANIVASPAWWFSTVLVAFAINLLSSYAKPWSDGLLARISARWRNRSAVRKRKLDDKVHEHVIKPHLLRDAVERESRFRHQAAFMMLLALFFLALPEVVNFTYLFASSELVAAAAPIASLLVKSFGLLVTAGSIAQTNAADRLSEITHEANLYLVVLQDMHAQKSQPTQASPNSTTSEAQ